MRFQHSLSRSLRLEDRQNKYIFSIVGFVGKFRTGSACRAIRAHDHQACSPICMHLYIKGTGDLHKGAGVIAILVGPMLDITKPCAEPLQVYTANGEPGWWC